MVRWATSISFLFSVAIHLALLGALAFTTVPAKPNNTVEVQLAEVVRPPPPPEEPAPAPEPQPAPLRQPPKVAAAPIRTPPKRQPAAPPPPNAPPPDSAPSTQQAPVHIGISMSSTVEGGAIAAPVGNSLYGKAPERAVNPADVRPYRAERYAPPTELTVLPEPIDTSIPRGEYPEEARRLGVEGVVRLKLRVDEEGRVREAVILDDAGHGLGQVAVRRALRAWRFRPGRRGDRPVATEIPFTIHFELS